MTERCTLLAVVPARGGSKRLPRKNVLPLHGRPLIRWTIDLARESELFASVLVSTDDEEIASVAREAGADVPWLRPHELATDSAGSLEVLEHALAWHEREHSAVDAVMLLQPTSPFRRVDAMRAAVQLFQQHRDVIVSVSPAHVHPAWCFTLANGELQPMLGWQGLRTRSQDLLPAYSLNGSIYIVPAARVREGAPLLAPPLRPFVMHDAREALDIDDADDWRQAEAAAAAWAEH